MFDEYVNFWMAEKIKAGKEGNAPLKTISKLMLNSCYGKLAVSGTARQKQPILDHDGVLRFINQAEETRETLAVATAAYITAYGRNKTIRTSQYIRDFTMKKYGEDR